jgi:hypothetical protein
MLELSSTAEVTSFDVLTNVAGQLWPPIVARDQFQCFETTWVARDVSVVVLLNNPSAKLAVLWDIDLPLKQHQPLRL